MPSKFAAGERARKTSKSAGNGTARLSLVVRRSGAKGSRARTAAFEGSSGNVYRDLGFPPAEAEYLLLRSRLMQVVASVMRDQRLTQTEAAKLFGVSQPRVSDVIRGRVQRFTIDALVEMLANAGVRLEIVAVR